MDTQSRKTTIEPVSIEKVEYVRRTTLFGIISWYEEVNRETVGTRLFITTEIEPEVIILNGRKIYDIKSL